jgi:hypothetical protein
MELSPVAPHDPALPLAGRMTVLEFADRVAEEAALDDDGGPLTGADPWRHLFDRVLGWRDQEPPEASHDTCVDSDAHDEEVKGLRDDLEDVNSELAAARTTIADLEERLADFTGDPPEPAALLVAAREAVAMVRRVLSPLTHERCSGPARKTAATHIRWAVDTLEAATRATPPENISSTTS